ncbi:60s ribosomal protein l6 [Lichtheimia corymbifera JMRC:FSU:9682]|uniref:60S ribosomal protein L6 n=1 Tax=Lichtheimia corymbifera JMRC:FSU:9682 TaxID=1263082 RepID=A0A068RQV0_9FUNG|nr:60s ribosomal protein l6 [Lichtheimia corymbifera JMRC:FSU:9682]
MTDIGFENLRISDGPHDPSREHDLPAPPQPATSAMPAPPGIAVEGVMWQGHDESDDSDDEQPLSVPTFGDNTLPPPPPPPMHGNPPTTTRPVSVRNEAAMQRNSFRPTRFIKAEQKGKASPAAIQMMPQEMATVQRMYEHYQAKVYMEGYLYRKSERSEHEGWVRTYVELCGPVLTMWDADKDDQVEVMPQYLNIADATAEYNDQSMVSLKAGGISRLLFEIDPDSTSHDNRSAVLDRWIRAIRLSCFEGARIHEIYTKKIIMRHKNSSEDGDEEDDILAKPIPKMESFLQVRFAGVNEWQKYWVVVSDRPNTKKLFGKKSSTPQQGQLLFYESKKAKHPIKVLTNVFQAYTIYPETPQLADMATLLKIDGTTGGSNSDDSDEGGVPASVLMMTTNTRYLVQWLVGVYDTFKLYGRPSQLLRDPTNANSLNFGETVSSTRLFLEVDEISGMDVYADGTEKNRMAMTDIMLNKFKQPAIQHVPINGGGMGPRTNSMPQIAQGPPGNNNNARVPRQRTVSADAEVPMAGGAANPRATMMMNAYGGGPNRTSVYPMQNQPPMMPQQQQQQQQHRVSTMPRTQSGKIIYASDDSDEDEDEEDESDSEDEDDDDDDSVFGGGDQHHSNAHKADSNKASPTATPTPAPLPAASSSAPSITDKNADSVNHNEHDDKQVSNDTLDKQSDDNEAEQPKTSPATTPAKAKQRRPNPINSDESSSEEEEEEEDSDEDDASDEEYTPHRPKSRWPTNNNATSRASAMSPTPMQQQQQQPQGDYQLPPFEIDQQPMMDMYNHPMYQQQAVIDEDGPIIPQLGEDFANPHSLLGSVSKTDPQVTVRDQAEYAKATGQPLVSISQQPKDPKAGLVGMISQIEHDKKNPNKGRMMDAERERLMMEQQQQQQAMMGGPMMGMMDPRMSMMPPNMMMGGHNSMMMMPMMDPRMSMMPPNMMMMPMMDPRMSMMNPNMMNNGNGNNNNPHASMMMPPTSMGVQGGNPHASMMMQQPPSSMPSGSNANTNPHASMMMPPSTMAGMNGGNGGGGNGHASMMIPMMDPRMSMMPPNMMMYGGGMWNGQQQHFGQQQQQFGIPEEDDEDDDVPLGAGSQAKPSSSKNTSSFTPRKQTMAHAPRNSFLVPGVARYSRSAMYAKKALHKRQKKGVTAPAKQAAADKTVEVKGAKNGGKRVIPAEKAPRFYPAEDVPKPKVSRKSPKTAALRGSITPGTVVILLAGRHQGKRVVVLKQLASGLLLVTGPFKVNGVPLRRVNQAYVIATSTKVDISGVKVDDKINDAYFSKKGAKQQKQFLEGEQKAALPESKVADQKAIDKALLESIKKTPFLTQYLASTFTLKKGQFPHAMKF